MGKYLLLAALLLRLRLPARAQLLWQQATGTAAFNETSGGFVAVPGGWLNVGPGGGDGTLAHPANQLYMAKVNATGSVLWQKSISLASRNVSYVDVIGVAADALGQVYVAGQCSEFVPRHSDPNYGFGLLVKLSPAGDTIWTKVLHGLTKAGYRYAVVTADGGVVVLGVQELDQFVAKFSPAGQEL